MEYDDVENDMIECYYKSSDKKEIKYFMDEYEEQFYVLDFEDKEKNIYSPSLLVCLNYLLNNKCKDEEWTIFTMKDH